MGSMERLIYGKLSEAWQGEASDFTPLLSEQLDELGRAIGVNLASVGEAEVPTTGGRRIDIVAQVDDGSEFVIENQYGRADHDHLTRGLAYAVARRARGLVVVAEEHRDEFRSVAEYLNELAAHDPERGIAVWLVEAKAVRIGQSPWAPLFETVEEPNSFVTKVEQQKQSSPLPTIDEFWASFHDPSMLEAVQTILRLWLEAGHRRRLGPDHIVIEAAGPAKSGVRTVVALYSDGRVLVPFSSYEGQNSGIPIEELSTAEFRARADALFGFSGSERQARTPPGWITTDRVEPLLQFCHEVADAYRRALAG